MWEVRNGITQNDSQKKQFAAKIHNHPPAGRNLSFLVYGLDGNNGSQIKDRVILAQVFHFLLLIFESEPSGIRFLPHIQFHFLSFGCK